MKLKDTIQFLDEKIPKNLAIKSDKIGFQGNYDLNQDINSIKGLQAKIQKSQSGPLWQKVF